MESIGTDGGAAARHKRRRLTAEERRKKILDAALELFAERGFAAATTRELAARAGITEPVIYLHFRSKEEVLREVFQRNSFLPYLRQFAAVETAAPLREQFVELASSWRSFMLQRSHLVRLIFSEMHHEPEIARAFRDTLHQGMALATRALREHADLSQLREDRLPVAVLLFFSSLMWQFLVEGRAFLEDDSRMQAHVEATIDLVMDGLRR